MANVWVQDADQSVRFIFQERLDDESLIVRIEEEWSTFSLWLLRIEHIVSIFDYG